MNNYGESEEKQDKNLYLPSALIYTFSNLSGLQKKIIRILLYESRLEVLDSSGSLGGMVRHIHYAKLKKSVGDKDYSNDKVFKEAIKGITEINVEFNLLKRDKRIWQCTSFLSEITIHSYKNGKMNDVYYSFTPYIWENFLNPIVFIKLNLSIFKNDFKKHTFTLHEIALDTIDAKRNAGETRMVSIDLWKKVFGVKEGSYAEKETKEFKRSYWGLALKELNEKTPIFCEYEYDYVRNPKLLKFKFSLNKLKKGSNDYIDSFEEIKKIEEEDKINSKKIETLKENFFGEYTHFNSKVIKSLPAFLRNSRTIINRKMIIMIDDFLAENSIKI